MTADGIQLPGLARSRDPVNIPLDKIEIGAYLAVPQSADPGFFRFDFNHSAGTRFVLIVCNTAGSTAVNLNGMSI